MARTRAKDAAPAVVLVRRAVRRLSFVALELAILGVGFLVVLGIIQSFARASLDTVQNIGDPPPAIPWASTTTLPAAPPTG